MSLVQPVSFFDRFTCSFPNFKVLPLDNFMSWVGGLTTPRSTQRSQQPTPTNHTRQTDHSPYTLVQAKPQLHELHGQDATDRRVAMAAWKTRSPLRLKAKHHSDWNAHQYNLQQTSKITLPNALYVHCSLRNIHPLFGVFQIF